MTRTTLALFPHVGALLLALASCAGQAELEDGEVGVTREEVVQTLEAWRARLEPLLPSAERQRLETQALAHPLEAPAGTAPIAVSVTEQAPASIRSEVARRDWAYAAAGAGHTLVGAVGQGQSAQLELGLWCYLRAALLRPDEAEHLSNVAFHLNARGEHRDAKLLLLRARVLAPESAAITSNLAFTTHKLGEHEAAIAHGLDAVALRPERPTLDRLRAYLVAGGYQAEAETLSPTESLLPTLPPFELPPSLSPAGEAVRARIAGLAAEMETRAQAVADRYLGSLDALVADFVAKAVALQNEHLFECPFRILAEGGKEIGYRQCMQCYVPGEQKAFTLTRSLWSSTLPIITSLEREWWTLLAQLSASGRDTLRKAKLQDEERRVLARELQRTLFLEQVPKITRPRKQVQAAVAELDTLHAEAQNAGCGKPEAGELKQVEEESISCQFMPFMCHPWSLYFGVGSFQWNPDGTMQLSLGAVASLKLEYNLESGHAGIGFGLGHNLGPLNGELSLMFTSKEGVKVGAEAKLATPPYGVLPAADPPKLWVGKLALYEHHP